jgi:MSHA pilin protein MshD
MTPASSIHKGFTLVELIILIVVISAALVGVLIVFQNTVRSSADPQVQKQALAIAEALLDEILLTSYDPLPGTGARANFDNVNDYAGYTTAGGMKDIQNNPIAGLQDYNVSSITVTDVTLTDSGGVLTPVTEAKRVTVTITGPAGFAISMDGYRLKYVGP